MSKVDDLRLISCKMCEIDLYKEHIKECDYPDEMERLIKRYEDEIFAEIQDDETINELRDVIEAEYSIKTLREIYFKSGLLYGKTEGLISKFLIWCKAVFNNKLTKNMTMIIIALIIAFAYIQVEQNKINYKEKIRQEEQQIVNEQREELEACIDRVEESYYDTWKSNCKAKGLKNNCSLPLSLANSLEKDRENAKKTCMDRFKNKAF